MSSGRFLMGSIAVLGGGTHEWLIWLANPLCFTAILCLIFDKKMHLLCVSFHNTFLSFCLQTQF
jgi:hypothetical protein